jgi:hypothetical protein
MHSFIFMTSVQEKPCLGRRIHPWPFIIIFYLHTTLYPGGIRSHDQCPRWQAEAIPLDHAAGAKWPSFVALDIAADPRIIPRNLLKHVGEVRNPVLKTTELRRSSKLVRLHKM